MRKIKRRKRQRLLAIDQKPLEDRERCSAQAKIRILDYNEAQFQEIEAQSVEECFPFKDSPSVTWIDIDSIQHADVLDKIGKHFDIHPLIMEDIANATERSKLEDFDDYIYIVMKMLSVSNAHDEVQQEQVSIILGSKYVITFQEDEKKGDVFDPIRERIRNCKGRIRKEGADYLAYRLVDSIVDNYFMIIERIGDRVETLEEELIANPSTETLHSIYELKRDLIFLHRSVWPLREVISRLQRGEYPLIRESTRTYLKDVYDHTIQVIETVETYRDMISGMLDIYLSSISHRTNEIMKVLTIICTIFTPLTFLAGVYGMNFEFFPEIKWRFGYLYFWILISVISGFILYYFRRRKWI
jgi:magnesium transporter